MATTSNPPQASSQISETKPASKRLLSLDALRGWDMFWIIGMEEMAGALHKASDSGWANFFHTQMSHKRWEGVAFEDLIFPLFVFIVGISLVFSLSKQVEQHGRAGALKRVFTRSGALFLLGIFSYGGIARGFDHVRILGVLQRISLCYLFASLLFLYFRPRALLGWCAGLLLGYWALMSLTPVRNISLEKSNLARLTAATGQDAKTIFLGTSERVTGAFDEGRNLANHFDFQYLPWRKWDGAYDPEGVLSTLPAIGTCLLGIFAGLLLRNGAVPDQKKVLILGASGVAGIAAGFLWGTQFPVIKQIWSSSYVLVAGGYACLFLAAFYQVIEIWKFQRWAMPFVWIGTNAITIYMAHNLIEFSKVANQLAGGPVKQALGAGGEILITLVVLGLSFGLCRFLYQRKIFLRL